MLTMEQRIRRAAEIARAAVESGECASAVIGAASSREVLLLEAFSPADGSETASPDAIYLLASITKTFFGTAFMQLAERGMLLLTDPVTRYLPAFGSHGKGGVTIRHLLSHTSGLAEEPYLEVLQRGGSYQEVVEATCAGWLYFKPGAHYQYCNASFWILGEIISAVSGQAYPDYLREHIWRPLGMDSTGFSFEDDARRARMMPVHVAPGDGFERWIDKRDYFTGMNFSAGGVWSSARDMLKYGQAQLNAMRGCEPALCSTGAALLMTRPHTAGIRDVNGNPSCYGLGWGLDDGSGYHLGRGSGFGHGGATSTYLWIEPELDLAYIYLTNMWGFERRASQLALNALLAE